MRTPSKAKDRRPVEVLLDLPIDMNNEKNLISCLLQRPDLLLDEFLSSLSVDDFHFPLHRRIFQSLINLNNDAVVPDPGMVRNSLKDPQDKSYLDNIVEDLWASPANARFYSEKLAEVAEKRQAILDADKLIRAAKSGVLEDIARIRKEIAQAPEKSEKLVWTKHRVDVSRAATTKPPEKKFIVGHLPAKAGAYGLVIGPDGVRKSWLALHIALSVACGRPVAEAPDGSFLWPAPDQGRVVYLTSEDDGEEVWDRVWNISQMPGYSWTQNAGELLDVFPVFSSMTLLSTLKDGSIVQTPEFFEVVEFAKGARVIIIDPLSDFFDLDENGNREGRAIVQALRQLSLKTGAGVLGVHHQNKASMLAGEKNHQSGRGSSKFGAGCRWAVVLQPLSQVLGTETAEKIGIGGEEARNWTNIHESKASYCTEAAGDKWFHKVAVVDDDGRFTVASAPLAARLPENLRSQKDPQKDQEGKYATAY